ncbi:MAG: 50S ribosomal protein L10 [Oscillospiraceae bacterium]|nr:50S ribosomal protein L10 [Oscillospiraceae bacterium]
MPSEKVLESKKARVAELTDLLKSASAGVIVDYKGITVEDDTKLRRDLREAGVNYFVEKNSMLRFAVKNAELDGLTEILAGPTAIAVTDGDETAPARILGKYAEKSDGKFSLKAGFIGKDIYDAKGVTALSKIPSKETLLAQLLGSLQAPMQNLAATLQALVDKKNAEESA